MQMNKRYMKTVIEFVDNVLEYGCDKYGVERTPLLVDGLNVDTLEPVYWLHNGKKSIISNLANQQNFFRLLVGLSNLTGEPRYKQVAVDATTYHFNELLRSCGLLQWGGHRFVPLNISKAEKEAFKNEPSTHELKCNHPYYELMWEINPKATENFIKALWNSHILDWSNLDMNRHGEYDLPMGDLWDNEYIGGEPFFEGKGLTFINIGSDLIYAAAFLNKVTGDEGALRWSKRLAYRYVEARDPNTKLGAYQYSQLSNGRDRAKLQFGPEFGEVALEGRFIPPRYTYIIYGNSATIHMRIAEMLGESGQEFLNWTHEGLAAYGKYAYDPQTNMRRVLFTDGTPLTPDKHKRDGYYGKPPLESQPAGPILFFSYALAHRLTGDDELWNTAKAIARGNGLGDIGRAPGIGVNINMETDNSDPHSLFGLLEFYRTSKKEEYLEAARKIGDNIIQERFYNGFFVPSKAHINAKVDAIEPLALLTLEATIRNMNEGVPPYCAGRAFNHGIYDGYGRVFDRIPIWSKTRK